MGEAAGNEAARRAEELLRRGAELSAGQGITEDDVKRAAEHAEHSHERDQVAHQRGVHRHYEAGVAHERAAEVEERAVAEGLGDVEAHRRAAEKEHEAARRNFIAAQESDRQDAD
ncbi:hypothetical protein A5753_03345 [Mycobacterium sp. 852002-51971_SCH5477799-a]|uniref:hypothetical protein n=1 Tax=Mycobacterium sp. 852002-51971_SCH5477799-a TaxID=1834106 RepID=UPI00080193F4|nr:hypothetical protein [Mycobacterium sp. 852002-51971_SCH5477799-a]OBF67772.1 hypothetical protein A5753_03345 [Mycobacterium sp. 852002-51971_SCH5477799-a]